MPRTTKPQTLADKQASARDEKAEQAHQDAAQKRAKALGGRDERYISALEIERQGYVTRGLDDRVAAVDEQIALFREALGVPADVANEPPANEGNQPGE